MGTSFRTDAIDQDGHFGTFNAFVGRRVLLADLRGAMGGADGSRLVTLTGGPGVGKTRLAKEYARQVESAYEHGVRFVELRGVPAGDTALLEQALMSAVRVPSQSARDLRASLVTYLRDRRMLLILDNCEHLVDEVGDLVSTLLRGAPHLRVLTTSRTLLALDGEALVMVPPLELPAEDGPLNLKVEAVQLLVQRARTGAPGWKLTEENWPAVREILRRFGGLPLGIELVVGQMRSLSPEVIAARLDNSPHQETLNKLIGPSYEVCEPTERLLLAAVSVFTGSFDLAGAERVCAGEGLPEHAVAEALAGLVDRSLVVPFPDRARYELLEPVRQFAAQRLQQLPDAGDAVRRRHRDHYRQVAARHAAGFRGENEIELLRAVEVDMPNLRAALGALHQDPEAATEALQMAVDMARTRWWTYSGRLPEQSLWLNRALRVAPAVPSMLRASAIALDAWMMLCLGDGREAVLARIAEAEAMAPADEPVAALLFIKGAQALLIDGDRGGMDLLRESHRRWLSYGPGALVDAHLTEILLTMGSVLLGEPEEGRRAAADFLAECRRLRAEWGMAWARWCQAVSLIRFDEDPRAAVRVLLDSVRGQQRIGDRWTPLFTLPVLAWALARCGRRYATAAARLLGAADGLHQATGIQLSRKLRVFAVLRELAEQAVAGHLTREQYDKAYAVQVGTVEDAFALVLDGKYIDSSLDGPAGARPPGDAAGDRAAGATPPHPVLTPTEDAVLRHVMEGLTNKQIAEAMHIGARTVETHVSSILNKMGVRNRLQLVTYLSGPRARR
ncbi:LuxR C-terminal-related transcriptional regulator [Saccharothrix sp. S26]|uniref:helix-turn-helix transcriptional regulator n=1 Tax=Saccharothrix sp. S26 TaxID=2907215 RepID=UPI001F271DD9|nr:LuxR C-terminal-related transcriptional regulator [Saccharothrix sp. S26]MCE7001092.1 LuxR C-terminal-related transcriptional regulator [Saccharothrix sp. S26]